MRHKDTEKERERERETKKEREVTTKTMLEPANIYTKDVSASYIVRGRCSWGGEVVTYL